MKKVYRKKPVLVDAVQYDGKNLKEINEFIGKEVGRYINSNTIIISTLEGPMNASVGDYIIKGVKGEFYPCKPDIFEQTYEEVSLKERLENAVKKFNDYQREQKVSEIFDECVNEKGIKVSEDKKKEIVKSVLKDLENESKEKINV